MGAHARLAPSSAGIWGPGGCPASVTMQEAYPQDEESPKSREGTAAHFYATETLAGRLVTVGELAPNGHPINAEMVDCAQDFIRDVRDTVKAWGNGRLAIEERVYAHKTIHADNDGTPDAYLIEPFRKLLHVWDFKYGHRYVDAFGNWQMTNYAIAALETNNIPWNDWPQWTVTMTVAQPRNYHPDGTLRYWQIPGLELVKRGGELRAAAFDALEPNAPFKTGAQCRDCTARHACPALQRVAMNEVDLTMTGQPVDLPPAALGLELRIIRDAMKRLGYRAEGLEEHALKLASSGVDVPHWRAEYSKGRERWKDEATVERLVQLGEIYGVDMLKAPVPVTPTQARKAGVDTTIIKTYSETPRGPMTLVPFDAADVAKRFS